MAVPLSARQSVAAAVRALVAAVLAVVSARRLAAIGLFVAALSANTALATIVRIQTTLGNIDVRLYDTATPLHVANMLNYINSNRYDGTFIHRSAKHTNGQDFVIQGGGYKILSSLLHSPIPSGWTRIPNFGMVTNEPGISNLRGTIALAKGSGVSSGTSEWFINLNDVNDFLDEPPPVSNLFTVFGRVIQNGAPVPNGMAIADAIAGLDRIDASVGGGAFGEVPVLDANKVISQQDIFNDDVVRVTDVFVRNLPAGDYDFNGIVNELDYNVWRQHYGSKIDAAADGNGDGIVDAADYTVWRNSLIAVGGSGGIAPAIAPEPSAALLVILGGLLLATARFHRVASR